MRKKKNKVHEFFKGHTYLNLRDAMKEALKEAIKEGHLEALYQYDDYKRKRKRNLNPDLISTSEAYSLRGRARVTQLILHGLLKQTSSGAGKTSVKYVSRKKLIDLDKVQI